MSEGRDRGKADAIGTRWLGRYAVGRRLGAGGMGTVYEAVHRELGKRFALKTLHDTASPEARRRFLREARAMARIVHPNSVAVFDVDVDGEVPFLVMELLEGEDLAQHCARNGQLGAQQTADLLLPVVAAMAVAHEAGIVHRDLKPSNVFLAARGSAITPKVLDVGIAQASPLEPGDALTGSGLLLGTLPYMSPEQAHRRRAARPAGQADAGRFPASALARAGYPRRLRAADSALHGAVSRGTLCERLWPGARAAGVCQSRRADRILGGAGHPAGVVASAAGSLRRARGH